MTEFNLETVGTVCSSFNIRHKYTMLQNPKKKYKMGIQLLTAYINTEIPKTKESLSSLVQRHVEKNQDKKLNILFDGFALLFHLFESKNLNEFPLCWLNGGDYLVIASRIVQYLKAWTKFKQVKLQIIFDGCQEEKKLATTAKRKQAYIDLNKFLFQYHKKPTRYESNGMRTCVLPPFAKQAFLFAAKSFPEDQIEIIQSPYEADFLLAKLASDGKCFVVTNDSDFFIFPSAGCITLRDIEFRGNMDIWLACTTNEMLADRLKFFSVELLKGLACLSKNDYNTGKGIEDFHSYLDELYPRYHQMEQIAKFINENISKDSNRKIKDRLFEVFEKGLLRDNTEKQKELFEVTKQIYDNFDVTKLDEKSKLFSYDSIIPETEKNKEKRAELIYYFKTLRLDSDLVDLSTNRAIQLNILIENPFIKGTNQLWTVIRQRIYAYLFFHKKSLWNPYLYTSDEKFETVTIEEGMIIDGEYCINANKIDHEFFESVFDHQQEESNVELFARIWKLENIKPDAFVSVLNRIDKCFWPIVSVYLALKTTILSQETRLRVYDWELESIFASYFQMDVGDRSKILEYSNFSFDPKKYNPSFRTNEWTSSNFHELVSLIHTGLRMFELCNNSISFVIPTHLFGMAILLNNGSLQKVTYEMTREQRGNIWFVDQGHHAKYLSIKKAIAAVDLVQLPKDNFANLHVMPQNYPRKDEIPDYRRSNYPPPHSIFRPYPYVHPPPSHYPAYYHQLSPIAREKRPIETEYPSSRNQVPTPYPPSQYNQPYSQNPPLNPIVARRQSNKQPPDAHPLLNEQNITKRRKME